MISLFPFCCGERGSKLRLPALRRRFLAREEGPSPSHLNKRGGGVGGGVWLLVRVGLVVGVFFRVWARTLHLQL